MPSVPPLSQGLRHPWVPPFRVGSSSPTLKHLRKEIEMPSITCNICNRTYFSFQKHSCGTPYRVRTYDEVETFYSQSDDLEQVACDYLEVNFSAFDYPNIFDVEIMNADGEWEKYSVEVEPVPTFSAAKYKKHNCGNCGTEFDTLRYSPDLCEKCEREKSAKEYEEWKREREK